jgi:CBS domain-containing protein
LAAADEEQPIRSPETTVGSLMRGTPVLCDPSTSIAGVARAMTEAGMSAAVIAFPEGPGIVTDVDLRTKVLAVGKDPQTSVGAIATAPVATIAADALAAEALFQMVEGGYHHLPVVSASDEVIGVVTETDVIGFGGDSPFAIRTAIEHGSDAASAVAAALRLPGSVAALVDGGVDAVHVGHVIGATVDVLTRRLLDLAFEQHGSPKVPWAWLAFGSLGRREQALHTDQDHGLAFDAEGEDEERTRTYFGDIAAFVTAELERAGMSRCPGNLMAVNPRLRLSLDEWVGAFERWIGGQQEWVAGAASIVCDFRRVAGPLEVEARLDRLVRAAGKQPGFLPRLAAHALENKPPTGRVRDFIVQGSGEHAGSFDLKHGGIVPITDVARVRMVETGVSAHRTLDRLRLASEAGRIDDATREGLEDAFRLLWQLRLEHQVECVRAGREVDDFIDPKTLPSVMRQGLREAFRIVAREQRAINVEALWTTP